MVDCVAPGETAAETFPKTAIYCHLLPFSLLDGIERGRLSPYNRHRGRNRLPANAGAGKQLQSFREFIFVAPRGLAGQPGSRVEDRKRNNTETRWNLAVAFPDTPR